MEIDLSCFRSNLRFFKSKLSSKTKLCLCVKANAYGHGLVAMAQAAGPLADVFSVAAVDEGVLLREAGVSQPILILSPHNPEEAEIAARFNLQPLISDISLLEAYARTKLPVRLHLKVDTGMGRLGCRPEEAVSIAEALGKYPGLILEGLCTHFSDAEEDPAGTRAQIALFERASNLLKERGLLPSIRHACNSAGTLHHPEAHYEMVRVGSGAVGYVLSEYPHPHFPEIRFCASLKSRVVLVKRIPEGAKVSYGGKWTARRPSLIGILPIGYADAVPAGLGNKGGALIEGLYAPIIGKICMDQTVLDLTDISDPLGKEALLFGDHPIQNISRVAEIAGVSASSIFTLIPSRVPRIYKN